MSPSKKPKPPASTRREFLKKSGTIAIAAGASASIGPFVHASPKYKWKMVTTWPKNFPGMGTGANQLAEKITKMSDGQIEIRVYGAGEIVPAMGVFDTVQRGTAQMGHGAAYYWKGKHPATQFFAAVPFGLSAVEMNSWLGYGGGQKLWDKLYSGFGLKPFPAGNTGVQMGGWFNKEIKKVDDFKGLKIRMPGLGGEVLRRLGAAVVNLPGGEIFQALKSGAIDATEWVGPYNDLAFGFHQAAKYYYWPGWHEPGTTLECIVNKKSYDELSSSLKEIVKHACLSSNDEILSEYTARNSTALETLVKKHKIDLRQFDESTLKKLGKTSKIVVSEIAKADAISREIYNSFKNFQRSASNWGRISDEGFAHARGLTFK